ncbi:quinolinate synthase NadA [Candidatus Micrarchaeota archaeon]|nr:quinolinate synthase NadA [Candidatus Micrarchaeota archaeon]
MNEIQQRIFELKKQQDAVILAHNYQLPEIQDAADFVGDSLDLCLNAKKTTAKTIVFCGVDFMAEAAAALNPEKLVLHPDNTACCPMAAMLPPATVIEAKKQHSGAPVVLYINTLASAKFHADALCTSANAVNVIRRFKEKDILFGPDKNLAYYVQKQLPEKTIIPLPREGHCIVHNHSILLEDVQLLKEEHPNALVLAHPECIPEVQAISDYILSTNGMLHKAKGLSAKAFIIATEEGICYRLKKENPGKNFYKMESALCRNMKKIIAGRLIASLEKKQFEVKVEEKIAARMRELIEEMLKVNRSN